MDCRRVREKFVPYLEKEARLTERLCVDVHTAHCYKCREELEDIRALLDTCKRAMRHPNPRDRFDVLMQRIEAAEAAAEAESISAGPIRRLRVRALATRLAAAAAILVAIGVSTPFFLHSRAQSDRRDGVAATTNSGEDSAKSTAAMTTPFVRYEQMLEAEFASPTGTLTFVEDPRGAE